VERIRARAYNKEIKYKTVKLLICIHGNCYREYKVIMDKLMSDKVITKKNQRVFYVN
jgi:hypothetical protein